MAAPHDATTISAVTVSLLPSRSTTTPVTAVPAAFVSNRRANEPVSSVRFAWASAGRTAITSASDFASTAHGNPSQSRQRTHALNGRFDSSSRMPHGE